MKSDNRTWLEKSAALCMGSTGLRMACGFVALLACGDSASAQQFPDRPLYVPRYRPPPPWRLPKAQPVQPVSPEQSVKPGQPVLIEPSATVVATSPNFSAPELTGQMPKATPHEVSVSGDFSLGQGEVTLPVGYSLRKSLGGFSGSEVPVSASSASRDSQYYGGTISYTYKQTWAADFSYSQGDSSGNIKIDTDGLGDFQTKFSIKDQWYQAYVRYAFPQFAGKKFRAYLRAGVTYVQAELRAEANIPAVGIYTQKDTTEDILGNLGFGVSYQLFRSGNFRVVLQGEGEGFFGFRTQDSLETLQKTELGGFQEETIDNTLYGGIGRGTVRFQYDFGQTGALKAFAEGGAQVKYTIIEYDDTDAPPELLWGPYVKVGIRYQF